MPQTDFTRARELMVKEQLIGRGIKDPAVLSAFRRLPRERFVPSEYRKDAYGDFPLSIGFDQTISQPYIVALMVESLSLTKQDKVLEIGTGSGYQTALLAEITSFVYSVERIPELARPAEKILKELGYNNIIIKTADGTQGLPEYQPYDAIIVSAAAGKVPSSFLKQLTPNGRMVIPVGSLWEQELIFYRNTKSGIVSQNLGGVRFVPLVGKG
ncbi:MAG: protein-L-isoaspartate(D-aspartate) O-methyltransferase [Candidatus Ratteibacteria bacterium]|jgi:protein-L-isoaspartate(D-aspartate) O-methyltransferase